MKKAILALAILAVLMLPVPARAQHLLANDSSSVSAGTTLYWNLITGNAVCTGASAPVPGCTGVGTGTLTGFPTSMTTTNIATGGSSGAWTLDYSLASLPVGGPYTVEAQVCIPATTTSTGACSANSPPFQFSVSAAPSTPAVPTLGP
ncbi:MAG: hypothetical protein ACLQJ7_17430 [Syntrophobacteraceae bacterium]